MTGRGIQSLLNLLLINNKEKLETITLKYCQYRSLIQANEGSTFQT
jgi:hypothetical protein